MSDPQRAGRTDGRKAMLVYLHPDVIKLVKHRALSDGVHAYELIERLLKTELVQTEKESS